MEENMGLLDMIRDVQKRGKGEDAMKSRRGYVGEMGFNCEGMERRGMIGLGRGEGSIKRQKPVHKCMSSMANE